MVQYQPSLIALAILLVHSVDHAVACASIQEGTNRARSENPGTAPTDRLTTSQTSIESKRRVFRDRHAAGQNTQGDKLAVNAFGKLALGAEL